MNSIIFGVVVALAILLDLLGLFALSRGYGGVAVGLVFIATICTGIAAGMVY